MSTGVDSALLWEMCLINAAPILTVLNDDLVEYIRAVDMQMPERKSPARGRLPSCVLCVPAYLALRYVHRRRPSRAASIPKALLCRLFR